jgi:hypothetical protein
VRRAIVAALSTAAVLGTLTGSSSGAGAADWKRLPYMLYESQQELITTDGSWDGGDTVKPVQPGQKPPAPAPPFDSRVKLEYIWPKTCLHGDQHVSMSKTFSIPGDPTQANLLFSLGFGFPLPFHSAAFLVNNVPVARIGDTTTGKTPSYINAPLPASALKAFHYGLNRITIRADKAPLAKGESCNTQNRLIGALAQLSLSFEPDLEALPSPSGREQAVRKSAGQTVSGLGTITFVNHGPSGSPGGKVIVRIAANVFVKTAWSPTLIRPTGPPFHACKGSGVGVAVVGQVECEYTDFPAGTKGSLLVIAGGTLEPNFPADSTTSLELDWQIVPAGSDLHPENNSYNHKILICGPRAKDPACANAK